MIRKAFFLTAASLLFLYLAWEFYNGAIRYDPLAGIPVKQGRAKGPAFLGTDFTAAWSKEIHEKNLFSPLRGYVEPRPVPVVTAPPPPPPPPRPELALRGVVRDGLGEYVGFIEINQSKAIPMRLGEKVEGIEVIDISERRVVVKWLAESITLSLRNVKTIDRPGMRR